MEASIRACISLVTNYDDIPSSDKAFPACKEKVQGYDVFSDA